MKQGSSSSSGIHTPTVEIIVEIHKKEVRIWEKIDEEITNYASGSSLTNAINKMKFTYPDGEMMAIEAHEDAENSD